MTEIKINRVTYFDGTGERYSVTADSPVDGVSIVLGEDEEAESAWALAKSELTRLINELKDIHERWRDSQLDQEE